MLNAIWYSLPIGSPSTIFTGADRKGQNLLIVCGAGCIHGKSRLALTKWCITIFGIMILPAQPPKITVNRNGALNSAVAQVTKMVLYLFSIASPESSVSGRRTSGDEK
jgi:hypothetical protein